MTALAIAASANELTKIFFSSESLAVRNVRIELRSKTKEVNNGVNPKAPINIKNKPKTLKGNKTMPIVNAASEPIAKSPDRGAFNHLSLSPHSNQAMFAMMAVKLSTYAKGANLPRIAWLGPVTPSLKTIGSK